MPSCCSASVVLLLVVLHVWPGTVLPCTVELLETIPTNMTYPPGVVIHRDTADGWLDMINSAQSSIDISTYYWTLLREDVPVSPEPLFEKGEAVFTALKSAATRGVRIRIVMEPPRPPSMPDRDTQILAQIPTVEVRYIQMRNLTRNRAGILHTKMWMADGNRLYIGSANNDWRALTEVKEVGVFFSCSQVVKDAQKLFEIYWALSGPNGSVPDHWPSELDTEFNLGKPMTVITDSGLRHHLYLTSSPPEFCTPGRSSDLDSILHIIRSANKFISICLMTYEPIMAFSSPRSYWPVVEDALKRAAFDRRVKVRIMVSQWEYTKPSQINYMKSLQLFSQNFIAVRMFQVPPSTLKVPYSRVQHDKYVVTDEHAMITTSNWSGDYFIDTAGVSAVFSYRGNHSDSGEPSVQAQLKALFERDWDSKYTFEPVA